MMNRHKQILDKLAKEKHVEVLELSKELQTSAVTIRKDLRLLEEKGLLFRTHGGASLENPYVNDRHVHEKEKVQTEEKKAIAAAAARLVDTAESIIIASGTTVLAFARAIQPKEKLIVITSALNVAMELLRHPNIEVLQLGGYTRHSSSSVTGHYAEMILEETSCNKLFIGVDGIDLDFGLTTTDITEAHLNQKMIRSAQEVIVLADATKFGKKGFGKICELDQVDHIITDKSISPALVKKLRDQGIMVTVV
ncbi:DeoR/GlpR family DNA-binding transcription regulator [Sinomicrobium sp. M5D2P17]